MSRLTYALTSRTFPFTYSIIINLFLKNHFINVREYRKQQQKRVSEKRSTVMGLEQITPDIRSDSERIVQIEHDVTEIKEQVKNLSDVLFRVDLRVAALSLSSTGE